MDIVPVLIFMASCAGNTRIIDCTTQGNMNDKRKGAGAGSDR
jgi:hypothetical protein